MGVVLGDLSWEKVMPSLMQVHSHCREREREITLESCSWDLLLDGQTCAWVSTWYSKPFVFYHHLYISLSLSLLINSIERTSIVKHLYAMDNMMMMRPLPHCSPLFLLKKPQKKGRKRWHVQDILQSRHVIKERGHKCWKVGGAHGKMAGLEPRW